MPQKKVPPDPDVVARLVAVVEDVAAELMVLRQVLDEISDEFGWAAQNDKFRPKPFVLTSMPKDPLAPDFGKRLNRFGPHNLPVELLESQAPASGSRQNELF